MTNHNLREWVNLKLKSGEITLEESRPFMLMSLDIKEMNQERHGISKREENELQFNFVKKIKDGITFATANQEKEVVDLLKTALLIINNNQGKYITIDKYV